MAHYWQMLGISWLLFLASPLAGDELTRLKYHHPGLVVDLGVGLWAWPVPADADGDGDFDLIVSCPDKPSNGVWYFENTTGPTSSNKFPIFEPGRKLSSTVHYVMPSYVAGKLRVLSPGYEYPDFTTIGLQKKIKLPASDSFHQPKWKTKVGTREGRLRHRQWRYADYDGDGRTDLIIGIEDWSEYGWDDAYDDAGRWQNGPLHGLVYWLRNESTNDAPKYAEPQSVHADGRPIDTYGCPSPNFEDFDGDGDLDLLCGEFVDRFTYFENVGTRKEPRYAAGQILREAEGRDLTMTLEMIVPIAFDWDQDGDIDLIVGDEDGRVALVENTGALNKDRQPQFHAPRYFQQKADELKCGALATPVGVDWDGDGDFDLVSGNTAGFIEFFENLSGPGVEPPQWAAPRPLIVDGAPFRVMAGPNGSIQGPCERKWGYTTLSVTDWDGDGLLDIVFNSILGRVQWLKRLSSDADSDLAAPEPIQVDWPDDPPKPEWVWWTPAKNELATEWRTTPVTVDWNKDGRTDLVMLDHEGYLAYFERDEGLMLKPPRRVLVDTNGEPLRLNPKSAGGSGRRKISIVDWTGDGKLDLLLNSSNADLWEQVDFQDGRWIFQSKGTLAKRNIEGHDVSPTTVDFNADGVPDFVGGAEDGRMYWMRNPRTQASPTP